MEIKTYKKTATIDAVQWDGSPELTLKIINWASRYGVTITADLRMLVDVDEPHTRCLRIPTLEGVMNASVGDYIAKGINDEFWPIKPSIMVKTYEEV